MKKQRMQPVAVSILGKEYKVACEEDEVEALKDAATDLDQQMRRIRDSGKVTSSERIAVMAALNLMHELRQTQTAQEKRSDTSSDHMSQMLARLRKRIETILEND